MGAETARRRSLAAGILAVVAALAPVEAGALPAAEPSTPVSRSSALAGKVVVAVSVDGLSPRALRVLGPRRLPSYFRMVRRGAATLNGRTLHERTTTLPNHTSMLTGVTVSETWGHRVAMNADPGGTVHRRAGRYVPSVFDAVHDAGGSTVVYTSKDKFRLLDRSWDRTNGRVDAVGANNGRDKIDTFRLNTTAVLVRKLIRRLRSNPDTLSFVHLAEPDVAGHAHEWMSRAYLNAVRRTDRRIGRILHTVRRDRWLRAHAVVLVTADHGGRPGTHVHSTPGRRVNFTVPFLAWGAGVATGRSLYDLNPQRRNPAKARTTYDGPQPVRNLDLADLVTSLLGLPGLPHSGMPGTRPLRLG